MTTTSRLCVVLALTLVAACSDQTPNDLTRQPHNSDEHTEALQAGVIQQTETACQSASHLRTGVTTFLDRPTSDHLVAVRTQWRRAHQDYARLLTAYELGRIKPPQIQNNRDPIDAHPLLPGYLDGVPNYPRSGLVHSEVPLTPASLLEQHQSTDFLYVTQGFHAMETLLWGALAQGLEERARLFQLPEQPVEDHINEHSRRAELLRLIAFALPRDLATICTRGNQWVLTQALASVQNNRDVAIVSLQDTLTGLIDQQLAMFERHPDGEDEKGEAIWHSGFARSDFEAMKAQIDALRQDWLGLWLPDLTPPGNDAGEQNSPLASKFETLSNRLQTHDNNRETLNRKDIADTRAILADLHAMLTELNKTKNRKADPTSEKAGQ